MKNWGRFYIPKHVTAYDKNFLQALRTNYYHYYYDLIKLSGIRSVFEIGVRAGYSMYAMLSANPKLYYRGIDLNKGTHGGKIGAIEHARKLLKEFPDADAEIVEGDSQTLNSLDREYDLAHIDGDHSYSGCLHDLELCRERCGILFADDYDYIKSVRRAVRRFLEKYGYGCTYFDSHRGHILIHTNRIFDLANGGFESDNENAALYIQR